MNGRKALIYEDDQATVGQLEAVFSGLGVDVVMGPDPAAIVDTARELSPDIIVLSADMKGSFSACLKVKKDADLRRIPLFMISGRTSADVIAKHQKLPTRADVYLPTPLSSVMLTEILREQLPALPAQPQPAPAPVPARVDPAPEIPVDDLIDRTVVSTHGFEASVVNFVEDEVRGLRDTVVRLQSEKDGLHGKIDELENMLRNQSEMFDSGIRAIREHQETFERTSRSEISRVQDMNRLIDEAVGLAVADALKQAQSAADAARTVLESDLAEARTRIDELNSAADESVRQRRQIGKLEKSLEDARRRAADAAREMEDTTTLFGRLETGYKEDIAVLEEERDVLRERVSETEDEIEGLNAEIRRFKVMADQFPALQEAAARNEVLSEENRRQAELIERLQAQVASLEAAEQKAHDLANELMKVRSSEQSVREELADLRTKFNQVRSLLGLSPLEGEDNRDQGPAAVRDRSE